MLSVKQERMMDAEIAVNGIVPIAAFIAGIAADTWGFAMLLAVCTAALFRGAALAVGLIPEFAPGWLLTAPWFGSVLGFFLGAVLLGLLGHLVRRSYQKSRRS